MATECACRNMNIPLLSVFPGEVRVHSVEPYNKGCCLLCHVLTSEWFQIGKGVHQGCICHPAYLISMQNTSCKMPDWMNNNLESTLLGEILTASDMQMIPL